ncbi:hypothetical protein EL26_08550 [Tumebacillus flagellatus]|uniref:Uncharacterized protein n=1 Tax=Tumebacillus flagellatus TaxID=1157490 RepID=A0A074LUU6_9BACL|nr:hypothetical protein EL26_08550 [Tumebacillus flagellatus]
MKHYDSRSTINYRHNSQPRFVRKKYFRDGAFVPTLLGRDILSQQHVFVLDSTLYRYDHGVYKPDGEVKLKELATILLGDEYKQARVE